MGRKDETLPEWQASVCEDEGIGLILTTMRSWPVNFYPTIASPNKITCTFTVNDIGAHPLRWQEDVGVQTAGLRLLWLISRHTGFMFTCGDFLQQNGIDQLVRCIRVLQVSIRYLLE